MIEAELENVLLEHEVHEYVSDDDEVDDENEIIDVHDEHDTNELLLFHTL